MPSKEKWLQFNNSLDFTDEIKSIVIDSELVLASDTIHIITDNQESIVDMFNKNLERIEKKYQDLIGNTIHFIALSNSEWDKNKKEYIKKIKEKYVYQIVEEPSYEHTEVQDASSKMEENTLDNDYADVLTIFNEDHVEIK